MSYYTLDEEKLHEMILTTAMKLIATDLVNEIDDSRYKDTDKENYGILLYELAAEDAANIVMASLAKALELAPAVDKLLEEPDNAVEPDAEERNDTEGIEVEAQSCGSSKSSTPTSASSKRSRRISPPASSE